MVCCASIFVFKKMKISIKHVFSLLARTETFLQSFTLILVGGFTIGILIDFLNYQDNSDMRLFFLLTLGILVSRVLRLKSDATFKLAIFFLVLLFVFFIFSRASGITERIAVWLYFILIIGIVQQFFEFKNSKKKNT